MIMTKNNYYNIPAELKALPNWVGFKVWRDEKGEWKKMPVDIKATAAAKKTDPQAWKDLPAESNNPATWCDWEAAVNWLKNRKPHKKYVWHIGFAFGGNGVCGIDLDKCVGENGALSDFAKEVLSAMQSYAEYSPSGKGVHLLAKCNEVFPSGGLHKKEIEIYQSGRFFTMTGNRLEGSPAEINDCTDTVLALYDKFKPAPQISEMPRSVGIGNQGTVSLSDTELLNKARKARDGADFDMLYRGDFSKFSSQSEADLALCNKLAFWTGRDAARMDALFRQSGLYRRKWDEKHGSDTYGRITVSKAIAACSKAYEPPKPKKDKPKSNPAAAGYAGTSVSEHNGGYYLFRSNGSFKELTNFIIEPKEVLTTETGKRMKAKLIAISGEVSVKEIEFSAFDNVALFKKAVGGDSLAFSVQCSENELQSIKTHLSKIPCQTRWGYRGIGIDFVYSA